jgi:hypothetical protein
LEAAKTASAKCNLKPEWIKRSGENLYFTGRTSKFAPLHLSLCPIHATDRLN